MNPRVSMRPDSLQTLQDKVDGLRSPRPTSTHIPKLLLSELEKPASNVRTTNHRQRRLSLSLNSKNNPDRIIPSEVDPIISALSLASERTDTSILTPIIAQQLPSSTTEKVDALYFLKTTEAEYIAMPIDACKTHQLAIHELLQDLMIARGVRREANAANTILLRVLQS